MSIRKLDNTEKIDSNTQTTINHWNLDLSKEQPEPYHYGGKQNNGKVLTVSADGFIRLANGGGGGGEPATYIKDITQASNTYTATKKDNTTIAWTLPDVTTLAPKNNAALTGTTTAENIVISGDLTCSTGTASADIDFSNANSVDLGKGCMVSATGTSTTTLPAYMTVNGTEYKTPSGGTTVSGSTTRDSGVSSELGKLTIGSNNYNVTQVSVSSTGTSTTKLPTYITINGVEYNTTSSLYLHTIRLNNSSETATAVLYTNTSTAFTIDTLSAYLTSIGATVYTKGFYSRLSVTSPYVGSLYFSSDYGLVIRAEPDDIINWNSISDTVTQVL